MDVAPGEKTLGELLFYFAIECLLLYGVPGIPVYFGMFSRGTRQFLASFMFLVSACMVMAFSVAAAWYRNPTNMDVLPDLGHDMLGKTWNSIDFPPPFDFTIPGHLIPEVLVTFLIIVTVAFALFHKQRWTIFKRVFCVTGVLFLFRSFTVVLTTLPDSLPECRRITPGTTAWSEMPWDEVTYRALKIMLPMPSGVTCGDMVFSGHTVLVLMCAMTWHTYYKQTEALINPVKVVIWIVTAAAVICITAVRFHYTVDILLGMYFSVTVWGAYHRLADDVRNGYQFTTVWLIDGLILYPAMYFVEGFDKKPSIVSSPCQPARIKKPHTNGIQKDKKQQ